MRTAVVVTLLLAACGGDDASTETPDAAVVPDSPPAPVCMRTTPAVAPTDGPIADPMEAPLTDCVTGGLKDLAGRWFFPPIAGDNFSYEYPAFEGDCASGFRRVADGPEDHVSGPDRHELHTWDDGTRLYHREWTSYQLNGGGTYDVAHAFTACMKADGTLEVIKSDFDQDMGRTDSPITATRFAMADAPATGIVKVGELGTRTGSPSQLIAYNLIVEGTLAYTVGPDGFDIIDVSTPATPVHLAFFAGSFNDVRIAHGTDGKVVAFCAPFNGNHTKVLDVTDPHAIVKLADIAEYSHSLQIQGTQLYLANYSSDVPIYNIADPTHPARLGAAHVPSTDAGIHDLTVDGTKLFVNGTTDGFVAIDIANGIANPTFLGRVPAAYSHASWTTTVAGKPIVLHGDEGWSATPMGAAYLRVMDGDPTSPTFLADLGTYHTRPHGEVGIHNILTVGNKAYIAYYHDGARIVDISDPAHPTEVAHYNTWDFDHGFGETFEGAVGIRVENGLIYIADANRGLIILREQ